MLFKFFKIKFIFFKDINVTPYPGLQFITIGKKIKNVISSIDIYLKIKFQRWCH